MFRYINLRYIIQKILIGTGIILLVSFVRSCEVKAETLFDYTLPQVARMGNITSPTGYDTNELGVFQNGTTGNGEEYDYISFTNRYTYRTYGTYLQFCTDMYMEENHTYNVVIAITTGPGSTSRYFKLGTELGMLRVTQSVTSAFYNYTPVNVIRSSDYHTEELFNAQDFQMLSLISVAFTLPENYEGKCLNFNIMTSSQGTETLRFYGYLINDNGIDYSEQFDELANSIKSSQNAIINNQNENANMIKDSINDMNNSVDNVNDSITDSSTDNSNVSNTISGIEIGDKGVITNLITMPITFFQSVLNSIDGTCNTFNLGNLFGTNLTMPCINISNYVGSNLWNIIDILFSGFFILYISKKVVKVFESFTNLKEGDVLDD